MTRHPAAGIDNGDSDVLNSIILKKLLLTTDVLSIDNALEGVVLVRANVREVVVVQEVLTDSRLAATVVFSYFAVGSRTGDASAVEGRPFFSF